MRMTRVTTSHWGAFDVTVEDGRIVEVAPFALDPDPSHIPEVLPAAVHHRSRVKRPSIRRGWLDHRSRTGRGTDGFVELPWDEALDIAAAELERVRREHGNGAIYGGSYGWASAGRFHHALSQIHRFLNAIGGYVASFGSYSTGAAQAIMPHVLGMNFLKLMYGYQAAWDTIADHTQTLVMFGGINPKNSQVSMGGVTRHQTKGWFETFHARSMHCINIGPQRTDAPDGCEWLPLIPGTDTAFMLGLAHVLESEGLADRDFLATHTTDYDRFRAYLMGETDDQPKTPEWAAAISGTDAGAIRDLARRMATTRTMVTAAWSLQRARHGEQPFWMAAVLAAMLGQIGLPGGGVGYGYGAIGGIGIAMKRLKGLAVPQGENPVRDVIPVARVADMLLNPGAPYDFNGERRTYPDIRLVYWAGGNPFHHHQDLNRLDEAWSRPETIVVNEPWWTPTAKRADIVFPATTPYEREDIRKGFALLLPDCPDHEALRAGIILSDGEALHLGDQCATPFKLPPLVREADSRNESVGLLDIARSNIAWRLAESVDPLSDWQRRSIVERLEEAAVKLLCGPAWNAIESGINLSILSPHGALLRSARALGLVSGEDLPRIVSAPDRAFLDHRLTARLREAVPTIGDALSAWSEELAGDLDLAVIDAYEDLRGHLQATNREAFDEVDMAREAETWREALERASDVPLLPMFKRLILPETRWDALIRPLYGDLSEDDLVDLLDDSHVDASRRPGIRWLGRPELRVMLQFWLSQRAMIDAEDWSISLVKGLSDVQTARAIRYVALRSKLARLDMPDENDF